MKSIPELKDFKPNAKEMDALGLMVKDGFVTHAGGSRHSEWSLRNDSNALSLADVVNELRRNMVKAGFKQNSQTFERR